MLDLEDYISWIFKMQPVFCRRCTISFTSQQFSNQHGKPVRLRTVDSPKEAFTWTATRPDSAAPVCCSQALRRPVALQRKPSGLFCIGRGIWLLSSGSRPVSNACLPCKQAAGSAPSCSQCAPRPGWAQPSRDTDPTPIAPWQPALIDPSNTLTSIYILFVTGPVCCVDTRLCTASLDALRCVWACACVWLRRLYCSLLTWIPFSLHRSQQEQGLASNQSATHTNYTAQPVENHYSAGQQPLSLPGNVCMCVCLPGYTVHTRMLDVCACLPALSASG